MLANLARLWYHNYSVTKSTHVKCFYWYEFCKHRDTLIALFVILNVLKHVTEEYHADIFHFPIQCNFLTF